MKRIEQQVTRSSNVLGVQCSVDACGILITWHDP